ncbi:Phox homologous domain-containing protein [Scheffersomyces amazonensis]|uniref:Phox homologous domain-containing protein n=1 Tax=Scheffersomyces amazonensis TaxID=1078765 RepID=UPI00315DF40C
MSSEIISIPSVTDHNGVVYYQISIKLPLRSINVNHRYSEFEDLVDNLSSSLGINVKDFPYELPSKRINWFKNRTDSIVDERKTQLQKFLDSLIRDPSIQNNRRLHEFLQLPVNFKFSSSLFKQRVSSSFESNTSTIDDTSLLSINFKSIDEVSWLEVLRVVHSSITHLIQTLQHSSSISDKLHARENINRVYHPTIKNLDSSLSRFAPTLKNDEYKRRKTLVKDLQENIQVLNKVCEPSLPITATTPNTAFSRRVFGGNPSQAQETKDTMGLSNQDLIQSQVQIHKQQDLEVEELRKLISRQRQIAETINTEVEEQNYLLDQFNNEVESTKDKLRIARKQAKNIL